MSYRSHDEEPERPPRSVWIVSWWPQPILLASLLFVGLLLMIGASMSREYLRCEPGMCSRMMDTPIGSFAIDRYDLNAVFDVEAKTEFRVVHDPNRGTTENRPFRVLRLKRMGFPDYTFDCAATDEEATSLRVLLRSTNGSMSLRCDNKIAPARSSVIWVLVIVSPLFVACLLLGLTIVRLGVRGGELRVRALNLHAIVDRMEERTASIPWRVRFNVSTRNLARVFVTERDDLFLLMVSPKEGEPQQIAFLRRSPEQKIAGLISP